jgi:hypothetical protein
MPLVAPVMTMTCSLMLRSFTDMTHPPRVWYTKDCPGGEWFIGTGRRGQPQLDEQSQSWRGRGIQAVFWRWCALVRTRTPA